MIAAAEVEVEHDLDLLLLAELSDEPEIAEGRLKPGSTFGSAAPVELKTFLGSSVWAVPTVGAEEFCGLGIRDFDLSRHRRGDGDHREREDESRVANEPPAAGKGHIERRPRARQGVRGTLPDGW